MTQNEQLELAQKLIADCERSLGYSLCSGMRTDLLADNTNWTLAQCRDVVRLLKLRRLKQWTQR